MSSDLVKNAAETAARGAMDLVKVNENKKNL
jgi:hypothetical protein